MENCCPNTHDIAIQDSKSRPSSADSVDSFDREFLIDDSSSASSLVSSASSAPPSPTTTRTDAQNVLEKVDTHEKKYGLDEYGQETEELRSKVQELQAARYTQHVNSKLPAPTSSDLLKSKFEVLRARGEQWAESRTQRVLENANENKEEIMDHTTSQHDQTRAYIDTSARKLKRIIENSNASLEERIASVARTTQTLLLRSGSKPSRSRRRQMPTHEIDCVTTTTAGSTVSLNDERLADLIEKNRMLENQVKALSTPTARKKRVNDRSAAATKKHIQNQRHK